MTSPVELPPQFNDIRGQDEQGLWVGRPELVPFMLTGTGPILMFAIVMSAPGIWISSRAHAPLSMPEQIVLAAISLLPLLILVLVLLYRFLLWRNTFFAVTQKRVLLRTGWFGVDVQSVDMDQITDLRVDVTVLDRILKVGTLEIHTGSGLSHAFRCIAEPYKVFKELKTVVTDIKTDWKFPNAMRPESNPGYRTRYEPKSGDPS